MFLDNKYTKWYWSIIRSRSSLPREKGSQSYYENHHIVPASLGGRDQKDNKILLTAKEHFICHLLLTKMTTGSQRRSMQYVILRFLGPNRKYRINSTIYESIRTTNRNMMRGSSNPMYGRPWYKNIDDPKKISQWRRNISEGITGEKNPFYGKNHSKEAKGRISRKRSQPIKVEFYNGEVVYFSQYKYLGSYLGYSYALGQKLCKQNYFHLHEKYGITKLEKIDESEINQKMLRDIKSS